MPQSVFEANSLGLVSKIRHIRAVYLDELDVSSSDIIGGEEAKRRVQLLLEQLAALDVGSATNALPPLEASMLLRFEQILRH